MKSSTIVSSYQAQQLTTGWDLESFPEQHISSVYHAMQNCSFTRQTWSDVDLQSIGSFTCFKVKLYNYLLKGGDIIMIYYILTLMISPSLY